MFKTTLFLAIVMSSPALALGQGGGTDMFKVRRQIEAMQQDGRYQRLLEEGRANRLAFERLKQSESDPAAAWSSQPRRR
jgi:hypothetical protein